MKRYYLSHTSCMGAVYGHWHYIDLASHHPAGNNYHLIVLLDDHVDPHPGWTEMPHIVDARTTMAGHGHHAKIAALGVKPNHTMIEAMQEVAKIHKQFKP